MSETHWRRVEELFAAALEHEGAERERFLDEVCGGDGELRAEVESLLRHHRGDGFLEAPASAPWAGGRRSPAESDPLLGRRLGRFEVLEKLGEGAMGAIYLAHDPDLERRVALKVLPPHLADEERRAQRLRREALALSALSHPNILTIYEVADVDGRLVLVSERIEGVTLRARLANGPLPVREALEVVAQVARGLAAAHGVEIVHRDVKPENVMIRRDGLVKLLDFGIAKTPRPMAGQASLTEEGMLLGTVAYMSPEQVRGDAVAKTTDLWALGCVLFEALSGRQAFGGQKTAGDLIAAILTGTPRWDALPRELPDLARSVLRRCLQKEPAKRLQDAGDAALELEEAARTPTQSRRRSSLRWLAVAGGATLALAAALTAWTLRRPPARAAQEIRFELAPQEGQRFAHSVESVTFAWSPDGSRLAYVAFTDRGRDIWVRTLAELAPRRVEGTAGAHSVAWSPDGQDLAFVADGKLKRVPSRGGEAVALCEVEAGSGVAVSWGAEAILFASVQADRILRVSPDGGEPAVALAADPTRDERRLAWPWWLPDGRGFLVLAYLGDGSSELRLADTNGRSHTLASGASRAEWIDPDLVLFVAEGTLLAQRLDLDRGELVGPRRALASPVRAFGSSGSATFAAARVGTVALASQNDLARLSVFDRAGREVATFGGGREDAVGVAVSPDGRYAVSDRLRPGLASYDLWLLDLERGIETRLTDSPGTEANARWLPDGRGLVFTSSRHSSMAIARLDLATGRIRDVTPQGLFRIPIGYAPESKELLYRERRPGGFRIFAIPLDGSSTPTPLVGPDAPVLNAALSPDGRTLAYIAREDALPQLFVRRLEGGRSVRASSAGAWTVRFGRDGRRLYYLSDQGLSSVAVTGEPELSVGRTQTVLPQPSRDWLDFDVLPGDRFLALIREKDGGKAPLTVIVGWNDPGGGS